MPSANPSTPSGPMTGASAPAVGGTVGGAEGPHRLQHGGQRLAPLGDAVVEDRPGTPLGVRRRDEQGGAHGDHLDDLGADAHPPPGRVGVDHGGGARAGVGRPDLGEHLAVRAGLLDRAPVRGVQHLRRHGGRALRVGEDHQVAGGGVLGAAGRGGGPVRELQPAQRPGAAEVEHPHPHPPRAGDDVLARLVGRHPLGEREVTGHRDRRVRGGRRRSPGGVRLGDGLGRWRAAPSRGEHQQQQCGSVPGHGAPFDGRVEGRRGRTPRSCLSGRWAGR